MKRVVLNPRPFIAISVFAILFLFSAIKSFAATKTWNVAAGPSLNWTTPGNWLGGIAPINGDDIVFNTTGTLIFTTMPAGVANYNSLTISAGAVTLGGSSALVLTIGSVSINPTLLVSGGTSLTLGNNVNITLAANATAKVDGTFTINAGRTYNTNGTGVGTTVFGNISNAGTITSATSKLYFGFNGLYTHSQNAGAIPDATWDGNSFCIITGITNTHPTGASQPFGNLSYDCAGMLVDITMPASVSIAKDFTVNNTNTKRLLMTAGSFSVGGDFNLPSNGNFTISGTTDRTLTVAGGAFVTGGNLDLCSGIAGNVGTLNVGGNLTIFGAITETGAGKGVINFNGTSAQTFNQSGTFINTIDFDINNTAGVTISGSATAIDINDLTLSNGILTIPSTTTLKVQSGNAIGGSGFGTTKHIATQVNLGTGAKGFLEINNMAAGVAYVIPVGTGTNYLPVTLTPANINGYDICVFNGITVNGEPNGTGLSASQKLNVVDAVYTVNLISGAAGAGVNMTVGWPAALEGTTFSGYGTNQIGISHWDGPNWGNCFGTGNNVTNLATRPGITVFSPFAVGKTPYVLPVKFSYLNASKGNGYNSLNWKAACGSSEVTFAIERSTDGRNFSEINSITASQSRCAQPFDYVDNNNLSGTIFYRIKSTEITGVVTYSNIVKVTDQQKDMLLVGVSPNPVINQALLNISTTKKDIVELVIVSIEGKIIQRSSIQLPAGSSIINLDVDALQKGVYMIKGTFSNGQTNTVKFTKQ